MTQGEQRFNPPPGWPSAPAGWRPPPGWQPPVDWPPVPPGWPLWLPAAAAPVPAVPPPASVRSGSQPWYRQTWGTLVLLVLFFPVGLFLVWRRQSWAPAVKWGLTAATALVVVMALANGGSNPSTPAANLATLTTPASTAAPAVTSAAAPPTTTAAAVVPSTSHHTSAAPVKTTAPVVSSAPSTSHTSRPTPARSSPSAGQPSTAPAASCYPLTNGGNCYEPGEFCRKSDRGAYGVAGNGERILCAYNNGWRWEPV